MTSDAVRLMSVRVPSVPELVQRAARGDSSAWDLLVDRFAGLVWAVARSHGLTAADAADVSQTTWLRFVEHLDRIREPERVGAWLATTARHESLRIARISARTLLTNDDTVIDMRTVDELPEQSAWMTESRDRQLWELFRRLPTRCQLLLRLLIEEDPLSYRDLGEVLEMPVGSIGPTRARCLDRLRRLAEDSGILLRDEVS